MRFERQGLAAEAVHHALEAHDIEACRCPDRRHRSLGHAPRAVFTLLGWLDTLGCGGEPGPALCIVHAAALMFAGQPEAAEARVDDAERASNQVRRQNVLSSWARQPWFVGISPHLWRLARCVAFRAGR